MDQVFEARGLVVTQVELGNDEAPPLSSISAGPVEFGIGDHEGGSAADSGSTRISRWRSGASRTGVNR